MEDEWDDYVAPISDPPSPAQANSPPDHIRGFHSVIERAAKGFDLPVQAKQTDCFLYSFKEETRKSVKSIPIVDYI